MKQTKIQKWITDLESNAIELWTAKHARSILRAARNAGRTNSAGAVQRLINAKPIQVDPELQSKGEAFWLKKCFKGKNFKSWRGTDFTRALGRFERDVVNAYLGAHSSQPRRFEFVGLHDYTTENIYVYHSGQLRQVDPVYRLSATVGGRIAYFDYAYGSGQSGGLEIICSGWLNKVGV